VIDQLSEDDAADMHASACRMLQDPPQPAKTPQNRQPKLKSKKVRTPFMPLTRQALLKDQNTIAGQQCLSVYSGMIQ
jgi:hypothetical protein